MDAEEKMHVQQIFNPQPAGPFMEFQPSWSDHLWLFAITLGPELKRHVMMKQKQKNTKFVP